MKERKIDLSSAIIGGFASLIIGLAIGVNWDNLSTQFSPYLGGKKTNTINFNELNETYNELSDNYDGELDKRKLIEGAKKGLVDAAGDRYTYYMTADEAREFNKDLNGDVGAGIGVEMGERDGYTKVIRTTPDNPAKRAGVLAGDIFYKIENEDVTAMSSEEIAKRVRGVAGTTIKLTLVRLGKEIEFDLVRETINNVSAYTEYIDNTAFLVIKRFDSDTGLLVKKMAEDIVNKGVDKIVLDLRSNGGGYVSAAKDVLSHWLDGKLAVDQKSKNGFYGEKTYTNRGAANLSAIKTVVLVNGSTASAAEIVAGALKDHGKAVLIGEKTFGKGSVQSLVDLSRNELLRVTIAKWYTPNGKNIDGEGIIPDKIVERSFDDVNHDRDPQLEAALAE